MSNKAALKYIFTACTFMLLAVPAVNGGTKNGETNKVDFEGKDKALVNRHVKIFVKTYIQKNRKNLYKIGRRSSSPFVIIDSVFKRYGLPAQLKYLAVVESELQTRAVSKVGAAGPWQLMPATARILGLKINSHHDERKEYYKSTRAAARNLKDLHKEFGDWLLVFAAYNSGEGTVNGAIKQSGSKNFWRLRSYLPEETREYVDKYIATCFYFEGAYSPALLSGTYNPSYLKSSKLFASAGPVKFTENKLAPKKAETPEEKYNRILRASDEALEKSNRLLRHIK
jgi:membrane-bound lytic murein transglycosylase D